MPSPRRTEQLRLKKLRDEQIAREKAEIEDWQLIHAQLCYDSFAYFVRSFWYVNEPTTPLVWGWWLDQICEAVQKQAEGDPAYRWLLVMQPYGTAKSRIMSVLKPAWRLLRNPSARMLYIGTSDSVVTRDSRYTREIMKSTGWEDLADKTKRRGGYKEVVALLHALGQRVPKGHPLHRYPLWDFAKDQDEKGNFATNRGGYRLCAPMGGDVMGQRGDDVTIDDPVGFEDIRHLTPDAIATHMRSMDIKARYVYSTRVNDRELSTRTMVMQRLDPEDPAGTALRDGHWKVICVPMEYDENHPLIEHMANDPRKVTGEVLVGWYIDPVTGRRVVKPLLTEATRKQAMRDLGATQYEAQNNQKPRRASGEFTTQAEMDALERYLEEPAGIEARADEVMITADFTFDNTVGADRVAIHCWARIGAAKFYLIDRVCDRMDYLRMKAEFKAMKKRHPRARRLRVEKAAAGPMVRSDLESEIPGIELVPTGTKSKWERAVVALQPLIRGRNIVLPHREIAPWVGEVETSWLHMKPRGRDDDDVDAAGLMGAQWGLGGGDPLWLPASVADAGTPALGVEPGLYGGPWATWARPMPTARYMVAVCARAIVVLDAAGIVVATYTEPDAKDAVDMADAARSMAERYGTKDVVVVDDDRSGALWASTMAARIRSQQVWPRTVEVDAEVIEAVGLALVDGRCSVGDEMLVRELGAATRNDRGIHPPGGSWSGRAMALFGAWAMGVRIGLLSKPGEKVRKPKVPTAADERLRYREQHGWSPQPGIHPGSLWRVVG